MPEFFTPTQNVSFVSKKIKKPKKNKKYKKNSCLIISTSKNIKYNMRETPLVLSQLPVGFKKPLVKQDLNKRDMGKTFLNDFGVNSAPLLKSVKKSSHNVKVTGLVDKNQRTTESHTSITQSSVIHMKYNNIVNPNIVKGQLSHNKTIQEIKHWLKNKFLNQSQIGIERTIKKTKRNYTLKNVFNEADKLNSSKTYNVTHCKNLKEYTIKIPKKLLKSSYNYANKKHVTLPKRTFQTTHDMIKTIIKPKATHNIENNVKDISIEVPSIDWNRFMCKNKSEVNDNMFSMKPYCSKDFGVQTDLCFMDLEILMQSLQNKYKEIENYEWGRKEIQNSKPDCIGKEIQNSTDCCTMSEIIHNYKQKSNPKGIQNSKQDFIHNEKQRCEEDCGQETRKENQEIDSRSFSNTSFNYISTICKNNCSLDQNDCNEDNRSLSHILCNETYSTNDKINHEQNLEKPQILDTASVTSNISELDISMSIDIDSYNNHLKKRVCEDLCVNQIIVKQTQSFACASDTEKNVTSISENMYKFSTDLKNIDVDRNQSYTRDAVEEFEIFQKISNVVNQNDVNESAHQMKNNYSPLIETSQLNESKNDFFQSEIKSMENTHISTNMEANTEFVEKSHENFSLISASFQKCLNKEFNKSSDENQELICTTKSMSILKTPNSYYVDNVSDRHISINEDNNYLKSLKLIKDDFIKISDEDESPIILTRNKLDDQIEDGLNCTTPVVKRNSEWKMNTDSFGKIFYINNRTGMTVYEKPVIEENTPCPYTICKRPGFLPKGNLLINLKH